METTMSDAVFDAIRSKFTPGLKITETTWNGSAFVAGLVNLCRPLRSVEVGAHTGATSAYIARAIRENGVGTFIAYEKESNRCDVNAAALQLVWPGGEWRVIPGDFFETVEHDPVDFAFIDIDPKSDYLRSYEALMFAQGAVLVAHDAVLLAPEVHVLRLRLIADKWHTITLPQERGFLLAVKP